MFMAINFSADAGDIQAQIYLENVTYEMGTDWNDSIDPNLKYL
jgi:hypothetical protein